MERLAAHGCEPRLPILHTLSLHGLPDHIASLSLIQVCLLHQLPTFLLLSGVDSRQEVSSQDLIEIEEQISLGRFGRSAESFLEKARTHCPCAELLTWSREGLTEHWLTDTWSLRIFPMRPLTPWGSPNSMKQGHREKTLTGPTVSTWNHAQQACH